MSDSAEWLEDMRQTFALFDHNGDGKIDVKELRKVIQGLGQNPSDREIMMMIKEYDLNKDGTIDFPEFCTMMKNRIKTPESRQAELKVAFQMFDKNKDGKISSAELMEVMTGLGEKLTMDEAREMISQVDVDQDNYINYEEFVKLYGSS